MISGRSPRHRKSVITKAIGFKSGKRFVNIFQSDTYAESRHAR